MDETANGTPIIVFWRATTYTFSAPARKTTLKRILREFAETELIEPRSRAVAWEKRQVPASDSRGLGFYWVEISRGEKKGLMLQPEKRRAVWNLSAYEKDNARLGYASFLKLVRKAGKDWHVWLRTGHLAKSIKKWFTS